MPKINADRKEVVEPIEFIAGGKTYRIKTFTEEVFNAFGNFSETLEEETEKGLIETLLDQLIPLIETEDENAIRTELGAWMRADVRRAFNLLRDLMKEIQSPFVLSKAQE